MVQCQWKTARLVSKGKTEKRPVEGNRKKKKRDHGGTGKVSEGTVERRRHQEGPGESRSMIEGRKTRQLTRKKLK